MPKIPTYDAKVDLDTDRRGMPRVYVDTSAQDMAARMGRQISGLGNQISEMGFDFAAQAQKRDEQQAQLATRVQEDNFLTEWQKEEAELQKNMPEGGYGFAESAMTRFNERSQAFLSTIQDPKLRQQYEARINANRNGISLRVAETEAKEQARYAVKFIDDWAQGTSDRLAADPSGLEAARAEARDRVGIMMVPERAKPEILKGIEKKFEAIALAKIEGTPEDVEKAAGLKIDYSSAQMRKAQETIDRAIGGSDPRTTPGGGANQGVRNAAVRGNVAQWVEKQSSVWAPRAQRAVSILTREAGLTQEQAAGLVGNLIQESSLKTSARNPRDGRDGSDSIGVAQWNSSRAIALKQFAASQGADWRDFDTQIRFVAHELKTSEGRAAAGIRSARSVDEAAAAAVGYFRPAGWKSGDPSGSHGYQYRIANARKIAGLPIGEGQGGNDGGGRTGTMRVDVIGEPDARFRNLTVDERAAIVKQRWIEHDRSLRARADEAMDILAQREDARVQMVSSLIEDARAGRLTDVQIKDTEGLFVKPEERKALATAMKEYAEKDAGVRSYLEGIQDPDYVFGKSDMNSVKAYNDKFGLDDGVMRRDPVATDRAIRSFARTGLVTEETKDLYKRMILGNGNLDQFTHALTTLDRMQKQNPSAFAVEMPPDIENVLTRWQDGGRENPRAMFDELKTLNTPEGKRIQETRRKEVRETLKEVDPDKVVADVAGKVMDVGGGFVGGNRLGQGRIQVQGRELLMADWSKAYERHYLLSGNDEIADKMATAEVRKHWTVSPSSGGRLVKNAPENLVRNGYWPSTENGDWLTGQVKEAINSQLPGVAHPITGKIIPATETRSPAKFWLYSTPQTDNDIRMLAERGGGPLPGMIGDEQARYSPVWQLVYQDEAGMFHTRPFVFDVERARAEHAAARTKAREDNAAAFERDAARDMAIRERAQRAADFMRQRQEQIRGMAPDRTVATDDAPPVMRQPVTDFERRSMQTPELNRPQTPAAAAQSGIGALRDRFTRDNNISGGR